MTTDPDIQITDLARTIAGMLPALNTGQGYPFATLEQEQLARVEKLIADETNPQKLHNLLGMFYSLTGRYEEAILQLRRSLELNPDCVDSWIIMGISLYHLGRHIEAAQSLEMAVRHRPDYPDLLNCLGVVYCKLNRFLDAVDAFRAATEINPEYVESHNNLTYCYRQLGILK